MQRLDFLAGLRLSFEPTTWQQGPRMWVFCGTTAYPHFFFSWRQRVATLAKIKFSIMDANNEQLNHVSWLETPTSKATWCADGTLLQKDFAANVNMLSHLCCFATPEQCVNLQATSENCIIIDMPKLLTVGLLFELAALFGIELSVPRRAFLQNCFAVKTMLQSANLDMALHCINYLALVGQAQFDDLANYLKQLNLTPGRFHFLPNLLFTGQRNEFLALWHQVKGDFPPPFWFTFWINALYRAMATKTADTSSVAHGLIRSMYKLKTNDFFTKISVQQLQEAAWQVYCQEHAFKNGYTTTCTMEPMFWLLLQE